ncbi:hypothetical protein GGR51DRAFT_560389 [Nemania sp. FL0031]|nr:hypothetical protein GGR51DRAFT_560389 [Nemania sp. FL0031]
MESGTLVGNEIQYILAKALPQAVTFPGFIHRLDFNRLQCYGSRETDHINVSGIGTSSGNLFNTYLQGTGIGIDEKIKEAYNFIRHNYENYNTAEKQDEIFLIGFSRGAFVARCVADLINEIGILTKMGTHYPPYVYDWW